MVIGGAAHLWVNYSYSAPLDGSGGPLNKPATKSLDVASKALAQRVEGTIVPDQVNEPDRPDFGVGHLAFGAAITALLMFLCLRSPAWPLHPIGLLMADTFYSQAAWVSVLIGWVLKVSILKYGGARLYRSARPFFIGLIVGDVIAVVIWGASAGFSASFSGAAAGQPYQVQPQ